MTSVLIVDDHPVVLRGFRRLMEDAGVATIHESTNIVDAYRVFYRQRPTNVIADLTFGDQGISGLSLIRRIRALESRTHILAFSMHDDPTIVARALESGAIGYILKDAPATAFLEAFDAIRLGRSYLDHDLAVRVAMLHAGDRHVPMSTLSEREFLVLSLLKDGLSYQAIADTLSMKYKTVINICSAMRQKLGVRTLADLIRIALENPDPGRRPPR